MERREVADNELNRIFGGFNSGTRTVYFFEKGDWFHNGNFDYVVTVESEVDDIYRVVYVRKYFKGKLTDSCSEILAYYLIQYEYKGTKETEEVNSK